MLYAWFARVPSALRKIVQLIFGNKIERAGFLHFCGTHGLTLEGRLFMMALNAKGLIRRSVSRT